jgi:shikimate kinase
MTSPSPLNPQSPIFLVGFMACGKSTIGPLLAHRLDRRFVDLDARIEAKVGCTIGELIAREGESRFRRIESLELQAAAFDPMIVIAPGGGAITIEENRALMFQLGLTIWLDAPFDLCWKRIRRDQVVRPLAPNEKTARDRYDQRVPLYRQSQFQFSVDETQSPESIAQALVESLPEAIRPRV